MLVLDSIINRFAVTRSMMDFQLDEEPALQGKGAIVYRGAEGGARIGALVTPFPGRATMEQSSIYSRRMKSVQV